MRSIILCTILLFTSCNLLAKEQPFIDEPEPIYDHDVEKKPWLEGEISLPGDFKEENLQEFKVDQNLNDHFRYFIDRSTLQTAEDGVTRFLVVIRSETGAVNTSYEGIRCGKRENKIYAYGTQDGLQLLLKPAWKRITKSGQGNYQNTLYSNMICNLNTGKPNPPKVVFRAMHIGKSVEHTPFIED
jgi:hypothetical protein